MIRGKQTEATVSRTTLLQKLTPGSYTRDIERAPLVARLGSNPGRVKPKAWKTVLAACPATYLVLMGDGCKGQLLARCCHWPATSAAFTAKVAAWPTAPCKRRGAHADHSWHFEIEMSKKRAYWTFSIILSSF